MMHLHRKTRRFRGKAETARDPLTPATKKGATSMNMHPIGASGEAVDVADQDILVAAAE